MTNGKIKKYRIACSDCGRYPQFESDKKTAKRIMKEHIKMFEQVHHETHNPKLVEVKSK